MIQSRRAWGRYSVVGGSESSTRGATLVEVDVAPEDEDPIAFLESARISWRRDWDAVALGFVLGVLTTLAAQGLW